MKTFPRENVESRGEKKRGINESFLARNFQLGAAINIRRYEDKYFASLHLASRWIALEIGVCN